LTKEIVYLKISENPMEGKPKQIIETTPQATAEEDNEEKDKLINQIITLKKQFEKIKKENKDKDLIEALNKYNKIKDIGQHLLGYIATLKNLQIKDYYEELEISEDEK
jgi:hypothetical protein